MRITGVNIYGFGCWVDTQLNFQSDYQIICGNNETGKTTLLYFIRSILFGFASARGQEKYWRYLPHISNQYGGEIYALDAAQNQWVIQRVKNKNTEKLQVFKNNQAVSAELYQKWLQPMTADLFAQTNFINRESLEQVYKLSADELLERILALGVIGSNEWLQLRQKMKKEANSLYRPRGRKQPLNLLLKKREELNDNLKQVADENQHYQQLLRQKEQLKHQQVQLRAQQQSAQQVVDYWSTLQQQWEQYGEWQQLKQQLQSSLAISNEEARDFYKYKQQIQTDQQIIDSLQQQNRPLTLQQARQLEYFTAHQTDFDNLQHQCGQLKTQAQNLKTTLQPQQQQLQQQQQEFLQQNPHLAATAQPLTTKQLQDFQQLLKKNHSRMRKKSLGVVLVSVIVASLLMTAGLVITHNWILPAIVGCLFLLGNVWFLKKKPFHWATTKFTKLINNFKHEAGVDELTNQEVISLQGTITQLAHLRQQQQANQKQIAQYDCSYHNWQQQVKQLLSVNASQTIDFAFFTTSYQKYQHLVELKKIQTANLQEVAPRINELKQDLHKQQQQLQNLCHKYHLQTDQELELLIQHQKKRQQQVQRLAVLEENLKLVLVDLQKINSAQQLTQKQHQAQQDLKKVQQELNQNTQQQAQLQAQAQQLAHDDTYQQLVQAIEFNNTDLLDTFKQWLSNTMAVDWINTTLNVASANRFPRLIKQAEEFFKLLTDVHYIQIKFTPNQLVLLTADHDSFDVHELSQGTAAQLYLALDLAFIAEIADLTVMPILIDDALVDFDQSRQSNISKIIKHLAKTTQVIYVCTDDKTAALFPTDHVLKLKG